MRTLPMLLILLGLGFSSAAALADERTNTIYLNMHSVTGDAIGDPNYFTDPFLAMMDAYQGKVTAIGDMTGSEVVERAKKYGAPIYTKRYFESTASTQTPFIDSQPKAWKTSKAELTEILVREFSKVDRTKMVTLHISGHGWNNGLAGDGGLAPEEAGIATRTPNGYDDAPWEKNVILKYRELREIFKRAGLVGNHAPTIRIVNDSCYGGGVHALSQQLSNVCTAAYSSASKSNDSGDHEVKAFWNHVGFSRSYGKRPTLAETFLASWRPSFEQATKTWDGGALGSTQFIRDILAKNGVKASVAEKSAVFNWSELYRFDADPATNSPAALVTMALSPAQIKNARAIALTLFPGDANRGNAYRRAVDDLERLENTWQGMIRSYENLRKRQVLTAGEAKAKVTKAKMNGVSSVSDAVRWVGGKFKSVKQERIRVAEAVATAADREIENERSRYLFLITEYLLKRELAGQLLEYAPLAKLASEGKVSAKELLRLNQMVACESSTL